LAPRSARSRASPCRWSACRSPSASLWAHQAKNASHKDMFRKAEGAARQGQMAVCQPMASLRERLMGLTSDSGNSFNTSYGPMAACRGKERSRLPLLGHSPSCAKLDVSPEQAGECSLRGASHDCTGPGRLALDQDWAAESEFWPTRSNGCTKAPTSGQH
jgi:hypothetical protein